MNAIPMPAVAVTETDVPELAITVQHVAENIPLSRLMPSKANVRRMNALVGISELADSIEAHGLIQNLTVRKAKKGNKYEVVAGARRLAALRLLVKEERLAEDVVIPCKVLDAESDAEISLAENTQREAMHIVDEILAYRQLAEDGLAPEQIASRFGQSVITVRQRLKLAHLSPKILEVMRADDMTVEQARALALSDNHDEQERVWFELPDWNRDPRNLRAMLTQEHVRSTDRLARFVGIEAYGAAGGGILRDLFAEDASTFLSDRSLLTQLAMDALGQAVEPVQAEGWKWVEVSLEASALYGGGYGRIYPQARELTEEEQAELSALDESYDALQAQIEAYGEDDSALADDAVRLAEMERSIESIRSVVKSYEPQEMALAGCIVTIDHAGSLQISRGHVKPEDRAALDRLRQGDADTDGAGGDNAVAMPAKEPDDTYSAALVEELTAIRTAAMRVELANRPDIALAALLHPLVASAFYTGPASYRAEFPVEVSGQRRDLASSIKEPGAARALGDWSAVKETWGDHLPGQPADLWAWLLEQPTARLLDLLAFVTAANLDAVKAKHDQSRGRLEQAEHIATALGLDMRAYWTPDAAFLSRLTKSGIADVLGEAGCAAEAVRAVEKAPKAEAVAEAEKLLNGTGWLPGLLRTPDREVTERAATDE